MAQRIRHFPEGNVRQFPAGSGVHSLFTILFIAARAFCLRLRPVPLGTVLLCSGFTAAATTKTGRILVISVAWPEYSSGIHRPDSTRGS